MTLLFGIRNKPDDGGIADAPVTRRHNYGIPISTEWSRGLRHDDRVDTLRDILAARDILDAQAPTAAEQRTYYNPDTDRVEYVLSERQRVVDEVRAARPTRENMGTLARWDIATRGYVVAEPEAYQTDGGWY